MMTSGVYFEVDPDGEPREWIFTFGYGHRDPRTGAPLDECFCRVHGTFAAARRDMLEMFGVKWAFQYASEHDAGVERHAMREISLGGRAP